MSINLRPLHAQVVIKLVESESVTKGGLIIPDAAKERPLFADVLAIGPGYPSKKGGGWVHSSLKVGERVLIEKRAVGTKFITEDGIEAQVIHESQVLGVVEA